MFHICSSYRIVARRLVSSSRYLPPPAIFIVSFIFVTRASFFTDVFFTDVFKKIHLTVISGEQMEDNNRVRVMQLSRFFCDLGWGM